jgi:hypothetical protein
MRNVLQVLVLLSVMLLLHGCLPYGPEEVEDFDIVATFYDENTDFGAIGTYALADTVVHIKNDGTMGDDPNISRQYDNLILDQISTNLNVLGYTQAADTASSTADVLIIVGASKGAYNLFGNYAFSEYFGDLFPQYAGQDWQIAYSGVSPSGTYSLDFGSLIITILDQERLDENSKTLPAVWLGVINGVAGDTPVNMQRRLINSINQCFTQSAYLGAR